MEYGHVAVADQRKFRAGGELFPVQQRQQMGAAETAPRREQQVGFRIEPETGQLFRPAFGGGGQIADRILLPDMGGDADAFALRFQQLRAALKKLRREFSGRGENTDPAECFRYQHGLDSTSRRARCSIA